MDNKIIQAFKNQLSVEKVLQGLLIDYEIKNEEAFFLCPFHHEDTASFSINLEKGIFNCFGCGEKGGDIVHFIMKYKTLGFVQSLELLSELTGVALPKDVEEIDKNELVQRKLIHMRQNFIADPIQQDYTDVYKFIIDNSSLGEAVAYLQSRGIPDAPWVAKTLGIRLLDKYDA
ncbi:MAG: CHC2 zinc finger domain-containing protein, partial [Chitinophagaceae bacterium]